MAKSARKSKSNKSKSSSSKSSSSKSSSNSSLNNTLRNLDMTDCLLILIVLLVICYMLMNTGDSSNNNAGFTQGFQNNKNNDKNSKGIVLMLFHADWCGHCKDFMPIWETATKTLNNSKTTNGKTLMLDQVESENKEVMKKYNIKGYPTIKCINDKGVVREFKGERTVEGLKSFADYCSQN
jgi:thiol-disulfide isomerase/thioredoxin